MGIKIELQQVIQNDKGLIVYVNLIDTVTNNRLKQVCVEGADEAEIKSKIQLYFQKAKQELADKGSLLTSVQNVLTEIEQEG